MSLAELMIMLAVIGILATIGVVTLGTGPLEAARAVKLEQDLKVMNSAVTSYLASGGDLSKATTPGEVLVRLKTRASEEQRRRLPGLGGSFLDTKVEFEFQSEKEANSEASRLVWSGQKQRFELAHGGGPGIRRVVTNDTGSVADGELEEKRSSGMQFAAESTWIWDYRDAPVIFAGGPSAFPTAEVVNTLPIPLPLPPLARNVLQPPVFSMPGGKYPVYDFPLSLTLTDPNPAGAGRVYYSVNYGNWVLNRPGEVVSILPESSIKAQVVPADSELWNASTMVEELYHSYDIKLLPPEIEFDQPYFVTSKTATVNTINVTLRNPNAPGTSAVLYQLVPVPGGSGATTGFLPYSATFQVSAGGYPQGFGVKTYASAVKVGFEDSRINTRFATQVQGIFGGHLDLDTSTTLSQIASGDTDAHTHDITGKFGISALDFFALPESKQIEIPEAVKSPSQQFKLTVVNADLSPGMSIVIDYEVNGTKRVIDTTVIRYDDAAVSDLPVFSLGGAGRSAKLKRVQLVMSQDVLYGAGIIPTVTGAVGSNTLGKENEWRNGALTIQAVAVNADGTDGFTTDSALSTGDHGAARSGMLWEAALFWHWGGDSYDKVGNRYVPGQFNTVKNYIRN